MSAGGDTDVSARFFAVSDHLERLSQTSDPLTDWTYDFRRLIYQEEGELWPEPVRHLSGTR